MFQISKALVLIAAATPPPVPPPSLGSTAEASTVASPQARCSETDEDRTDTKREHTQTTQKCGCFSAEKSKLPYIPPTKITRKDTVSLQPCNSHSPWSAQVSGRLIIITQKKWWKGSWQWCSWPLCLQDLVVHRFGWCFFYETRVSKLASKRIRMRCCSAKRYRRSDNSTIWSTKLLLVASSKHPFVFLMVSMAWARIRCHRKSDRKSEAERRFEAVQPVQLPLRACLKQEKRDSESGDSEDPFWRQLLALPELELQLLPGLRGYRCFSPCFQALLWEEVDCEV